MQNSTSTNNLIEKAHQDESRSSDHSQIDDQKTSDQEPEPNDPIDDEKEQFRLGGRPPFQTILHLIVGPLLSQIVQSCYGLMGSFWVSKTIGHKGMTCMSIVIVVEFIVTALAQYFNVSMSTRISYLFGRNLKKECAQVVVDIFRFCIIFGILTPAILIPCVKPLMRWYGGNDEIVEMCFEYLVIALCCSSITYTYLSLCGLLQAMGNSLIYGICQLCSSLLNMFVFDPLFLVALHSGMWGVPIAACLSNLCPTIVVYICLFCGKFTVKPKFVLYIRKFNMNSFDALRVALSQLIANLAGSLPALFLSKLITAASTRAGNYTEVMASWNVMDRIYVFAISVCNGLNQGFLPAASYAFGRNRIPRLGKMYLITIGLGTAWTMIVVVCEVGFPRFWAKIWGNDPEYLDICSQVLRNSNYACMANQVVLTTTACLQAVKMVTLSIVTSVITMLIPIPVFGVLLYITGNDNPIRLFYAFLAHDGWALFITLIVIVWKLRFLLKSVVEEDIDPTMPGFEGKAQDTNDKSDIKLENIEQDSIKEQLLPDNDTSIPNDVPKNERKQISNSDQFNPSENGETQNTETKNTKDSKDENDEGNKKDSKDENTNASIPDNKLKKHKTDKKAHKNKKIRQEEIELIDESYENDESKPKFEDI